MKIEMPPLGRPLLGPAKIEPGRTSRTSRTSRKSMKSMKSMEIRKNLVK